MTQELVGGSDGSIIPTDRKLKERFLVHASSEHPLESQPSKSPWNSVHDAVDAFYRFSRPHTVIGTVRSTTPILFPCHLICHTISLSICVNSIIHLCLFMSL